MTEQKNKKLLDQTCSWFLNRSLFSDHFLQARLPEWNEWKIDAELREFREKLLSLFRSQKAILPTLNEAQTEKEFIQPVLNLLGYANSYIVQASTKLSKHAGRPDYAFFPDEAAKNNAYQKTKHAIDYAQCIGIADAKYWERELDLTKSSDRDTFTNLNPSFQIVNYLTGTQQKWGILTNGRIWRLYYIKSHLPLGNYYQVDLVQLLEQAPGEALKYFYIFFRKQALLLGIDGKTFLDHVFEESNEYAVELEADIKERAYKVIELLCKGFAANFAPEQLHEQTLKDIYSNSLILLYRLLFVFYAEARELLPLTTSISYRDNYSMRKLTHDIDEVVKRNYELSSQANKYYQSVSNLFELIDSGDHKLGIPEYNGGLFDSKEHPFLVEHVIADAFLVPAIHKLARVIDKKLGLEVSVDYNTLTERHLGSIYEGLLEFKPRIAQHDLVTIKEKGSTKYARASEYPNKNVAYRKGELYLVNDKGERKASGSYYTPEYIVNYIVENTLDPLVKEAQEKAKALKPKVDKAVAEQQKHKKEKQGSEPVEKYDRRIAQERERLLEPYLSLKVLDPAMGSGHFLARATDVLAVAIATDPSIESMTDLDEESELTYYRRRIVESCIYGVDLNPLAVELAKLTLWLSTMAKSKPLSFLNHHLKVGNSLIGAKIAELDEIASAKLKRKRGKIIDLSRAPVQLGLFHDAFNKKLSVLLHSRALIMQLPTETVKDIRQKEDWERDFKHGVERFRILAHLWISTYFGNKVDWDEYNTLVENLQVPQPEWDKLLQKRYVQKAVALQDDKRFFHWELEFPEVFYDEQSNRKENAGFDAVIGNPPWIRVSGIDDVEDNFMRNRFETLFGHLDLYIGFVQLEVDLLRQQGYLGLITPNKYLVKRYANRLRPYLLDHCRIVQLIDISKAKVFPEAAGYPLISIFERTDDGSDANEVSITILPEEFDHRLFTNLANVKPSLGMQLLRYSVRQGDFRSNEYSTFDVLMDPAEKRLTTKIEKVSVTLGRLAQLLTGTPAIDKFYQWDALLFNESELSNQALAKDEYLRFIVAGSVRSYCINWDIPIRAVKKDLMKPYLKFHAKAVGDSKWRVFQLKKIVIRGNDIKLTAAYDDTPFANLSLYSVVFYEDRDNLNKTMFLLALLNSKLLSIWYRKKFGAANISGGYITFNAVYLEQLPIRRINFSTSEEERQRLVAEGKKLYRTYLKNKNWSKLLAFVDECLPQKADGKPDTKQEKSDVLHDLLAFLAEEMTRLHKEKQSATKTFLNWLEKEILKGSVEDQKNKTKMKDFHKNTFEDLLGVLKKNKVVPDPCPSSIRDAIAKEFQDSIAVLGPLKTRIEATDKLIDQIVYKLYGLTDAEIAIVEGQKP